MIPNQERRVRRRRGVDSTNDEVTLASVERMRGELLPSRERENAAGEPPAGSAGVEAAPRPRWTLDRRVRDILLDGVSIPERVSILNAVNIPSTVRFQAEVIPPETLMLNDFLRHNACGLGVVDSNENITMEVFIANPAMFIQDEALGKLITGLSAYESVVAEHRRAREEFKLRESMWEAEVEKRRLLEETADYLESKGVYFLRQWERFNNKESVSSVERGILDGVLDAVKTQEAVPPDAASVVIEGAYESVYNAKWHYVEGVADGGFGMQVKEGKPPTVWTENEVLRGSVEEDNDDDIEEREDGRLELMVLTSENGWPYTVFNTKKTGDIYVNKEVMRVWHIIVEDLDRRFVNTVSASKDPTPYVLMGTPGIGKSFAAGSFLLHKLLQYDAERLPVVVYFIDGGAYLFEKDSNGGRVAWDKEINVVQYFLRGPSKPKRGYIVYDVDGKSKGPPIRLPPSGWGMIVLSSPNKEQFQKWEKQNEAEWIVMNCPTPREIKAICAWKGRGHPAEIENYWNKIKEHLDKIGSTLRYVFNDERYTKRSQDVKDALKDIKKENITEYKDILTGKGEWRTQSPSHKLVKIYRLVIENKDRPRNAAITSEIRKTILHNVMMISYKPYMKFVSTDRGIRMARNFEKHGVLAFTDEDFVAALCEVLRILQPPKGQKSQESVLKQGGLVAHAQDGHLFFPISKNYTNKNIEYNRLYQPYESNFPLVDAFYFVKSAEGKVTLIGIQTTIADRHPTTANGVGQFNEHLGKCFADWVVISQNASWEIIYMQPHDGNESGGIRKWQECTLNPSGGRSVEERESIIAFWNEKVNQYQANLSVKMMVCLVTAFEDLRERKSQSSVERLIKRLEKEVKEAQQEANSTGIVL